VFERQRHAGAGLAVAARGSSRRTVREHPRERGPTGATSLTREQSYAASPGYTAETSTLTLIQVFPYAISALGRLSPVGLVATRGGLARTSVYQYFSSVEELLTAVVADVLPERASQVAGRVAQASTPGGRVWAYIEASVDLFAGS
jgi:hypothetical protein